MTELFALEPRDAGTRTTLQPIPAAGETFIVAAAALVLAASQRRQ